MNAIFSVDKSVMIQFPTDIVFIFSLVSRFLTDGEIAEEETALVRMQCASFS
jgi:hypothetical protein